MKLRRLAPSLFLAAALPVPAAERVLFAFDDHSIPWQHNLKTTLVPAEKHPDNPVLRRGPAGAPDHGHAILYGTVLKIGGLFRMWYLGMAESEIRAGQAPGWWRPMCYAESRDGVRWTKPELGLVEFNGSRRNNICRIAGTPESLTRINDFLSVLHDPDDPDSARRYKAVYIAHVPREEIRGGMSGIGPAEKRICSTVCATSADGLSWQVVGDRPANAGGERFEASGLYRFGQFYYVTGQLISPWSWLADGGAAGRVMLAYRSPDFAAWSPARAFAFARPGQLASPPVPGQQTHMGAGLWNRGNVLVGLYGQWQDPDRKPAPGAPHLQGTAVDLGLLLSNDGIHFREPVPGFKVIARGPPGSWDDVALLQGHAFVNEGDRTLVWYSHWDTGAKLKTMDIGLATLRRDGFGHLSPQFPEHEAQFITQALAFTASTRLHLNVDGVSAAAPLRLELLDDRDQPLPDFAGAAAAVVAQSGVRVPVAWAKPLPAARTLAVRVRYPAASQARVHALYLTD